MNLILLMVIYSDAGWLVTFNAYKIKNIYLNSDIYKHMYLLLQGKRNLALFFFFCPTSVFIIAILLATIRNIGRRWRSHSSSVNIY